jgi:hypothetical protein
VARRLSSALKVPKWRNGNGENGNRRQYRGEMAAMRISGAVSSKRIAKLAALSDPETAK